MENTLNLFKSTELSTTPKIAAAQTIPNSVHPKAPPKATKVYGV